MIMPNDNHIVVHSLLDLRDLSGLVQVSLFLNDELLLFDCQLQKSEFTILWLCNTIHTTGVTNLWTLKFEHDKLVNRMLVSKKYPSKVHKFVFLPVSQIFYIILLIFYLNQLQNDMKVLSIS